MASSNQLNIITGSVLPGLDGSGFELVASLCASAHVARFPGTFAAMLWQVEDAVKATLVIRFVGPPADALQRDEQVLRAMRFDPDDPLYCGDLRKLLAFGDGDWDFPVLFYWYPGGKQCDNDGKLAPDIATLLSKVLFGGRPASPIPARWVDAFACLQCFLLC